jgi:hypothetical protein
MNYVCCNVGPVARKVVHFIREYVYISQTVAVKEDVICSIKTTVY